MPSKKKQSEQEEVLEQATSEETTTEKEEVKVKYPKIRGGICEHCGIPAKECEHYKDIFTKGEFRCLCGGNNNSYTFNQSIYFYVEKYKVWICNSDECRQRIALMGGYRDPEILKFFHP